MSTTRSKIIIGISGASGAIYGIRLLEALRQANCETHLVFSKSAPITIAAETNYSPDSIKKLADFCYAAGDIAARIASGSFITKGMIIAPCSIRTMSCIATGNTDSLISRAADVVLKEKRPLILMVRETPLHLGHLRTMAALAEMGATIVPPVPAFYTKPASVDDIINHTVGRTLDLLGIETPLVKRWDGYQKSEL